MNTTATTESFFDHHIHVGRVVAAAPSPTRKPTVRLTIDFGPDIGEKVSYGAYTNYDPTSLVGRLVCAVVNLPPRKIGPVTSEVLVLGVELPTGGTLALVPDGEVPVGSKVT